MKTPIAAQRQVRDALVEPAREVHYDCLVIIDLAEPTYRRRLNETPPTQAQSKASEDGSGTTVVVTVLIRNSTE